MLGHLRPAITLLLLSTFALGLGYPLAFVAIGKAFPGAEGSPVRRNGEIVGSALIGQTFTADRYFWPRPSATTAPDPKDPSKTVDAPYNAANSSGSNLGPLSQKLVERVKGDAAGRRMIPADAITTSASGLDPHISPQNAATQIPRVAKARGLSEERVRNLMSRHIQEPILGLIGERQINVLLLNLELDEIK